MCVCMYVFIHVFSNLSCFQNDDKQLQNGLTFVGFLVVMQLFKMQLFSVEYFLLQLGDIVHVQKGEEVLVQNIVATTISNNQVGGFRNEVGMINLVFLQFKNKVF
eukprot:TRINITY_DN7958_c0_g1_i1.p3 TRINITY_DN7958_c0_g1~~TRINITY_DN7958_c0_g1_i1.p3  ORF type:complete len:105 (-),score=7.77 TRINITY_DN7958_c0_g1_i1:75-389(-)